MKHFLPVFLFLIIAGSISAQQTIYVKHDAGGGNNGTSWTDAYTTLYAALGGASAGDQIWVAAGTYTPNAGTANSSFILLTGISVYGGFNGTESVLSARNPETNVTILSGDLAGDDIAGDFNTNRADNSYHVIQVGTSADPTARAVIDGFTISGGNTAVGAANPADTRYGGGVFVLGRATVRNCHFTDNNGEYGGSLAAIDDISSTLMVDNCLFDYNTTSLLSAGIYLNGLLSGAVVKNSEFKDNATIRSCLYLFGSADVVVDSCRFENNTAGTEPCAGMYIWQTPFTLTNSTFINNTGSDYGAIYNDGRDGSFPFTIDKCVFDKNQVADADPAASAVGGAIFNFMPTGEIKNCVFRNNSADRGGALYNSGRATGAVFVIDNCLFESNAAVGTSSRGGGMYNTDANIEIKNCMFKTNSTATSAGSGVHNASGTSYYIHDCDFINGTASFGGAAGNYNAGTIGIYENCLFQGNSAATSGGAITNGFEAETTLKKCTLDGNTARFGAGVYAQNANTGVIIDSCVITGNTAEATGGGVYMSGGNDLIVENSLFEVNTGDIGGAIAVTDDTLDNGSAVIRNTVIRYNFSSTQAAGLNVSNEDVLLENVLFTTNQNLGTGAGGAISNNASATTNGSPSTSPIQAINCTIVDNVATLGAGIAQWTDGVGSATLEMQNCILANNLLANYEIEAGVPEVTSLGGNLSTDLTLALVLTMTNDLLELDPMFEDPGNFDYHLKAGSPCIDKGIATGAPTTDLDGNPRGSSPDQGCYEYQMVGTRPLYANVLPIRLIPNPVAERTIMVIESEVSGDARVQVVAQNGAVVRSFNTVKPAGLWAYPIDAHDLPSGVYSVQVYIGSAFYEGSFVKM